MTHRQQNPLVSPLRFTAIIIILSCAVISSTLIFLPCWRCTDGDQREGLHEQVQSLPGADGTISFWAFTLGIQRRPQNILKRHGEPGCGRSPPLRVLSPFRCYVPISPLDSSLLAAFRYLFPLPSLERSALPEKSRVTLSRTYSTSSILISSITPKITTTELQYCIACTFKLLCLIANILCICYISYIKPVVSTHNVF